MAFDDDPVLGGTVATLIDTDRDNNANFAFVASVDRDRTELELYRCDDTVTDGCGAAVLARTYAAAERCTGTGAGPWDTDTLVEASLPFADVGVTDDPVIFTSLVSYAAASLLNSAKDSVLGTNGQDYTAGIFFDPLRGFARYTGGVGSGFVVRRSGDPAAVRTAPVHATVSSAPWDDLPGTLADGEIHFYVVEKVGGVPVSLSAVANRYDGTVRLGFDDDDALSAPVDPVTSTLAADAATTPADGTTVATIRLVPRDGHEVPIGAGCRVEVDPFALAPAVLADAVIDHGDGSYSVRLVSTAAGVATVLVTVEGITLVSRPTVTFE